MDGSFWSEQNRTDYLRFSLAAWTQLPVHFSLRKNSGPRKPEIFYVTSESYHGTGIAQSV